MPTAKCEHPLPGNCPALPSVETAKQHAQHNSRKPAIRLALSARGSRKEPGHSAAVSEHQRGSQTERQMDKESSHIETFYKTRYCRYFTQQGNCWKGSECQFAHSESELRTPPDLTKTRMCAMYRLGCCKLSSEECSFAHSLGDLKATDNFYKTEICSFWANGFCRAGDACRHAHGEEEIRPRQTRAKPRSEVKAACSPATTSKSQSPELTAVEESGSNSDFPSVDAEKASKYVSGTLPATMSTLSSSHTPSGGVRDKMLSSTATSFSSVTSAASVTLPRSGRSGHALPRKARCHPSELEACRSSSSSSCDLLKSHSTFVKKGHSPGLGSVGASTPETFSEDFTSSSTTSQTPRLTSTVFVPSPVPCFMPTAPWMYMQSIPSSRQIVGIPLDDALNDEGLDREGFCLGVPSFSSQVVTVGYLVGQPTPPTIPAAACASWAYPAPYSIAAFESHIVY